MTAGTAPSHSLPAGVPDARSSRRVRRALRLRAWRAPAVAAILFLAVHLAYLAPTLDDIDAVNFAFGVRAFDPALHHPHPPGYPVYIALGKLSAPIAGVLRPAGVAGRLQHDAAALGLALWSAIGGAIALLACYAVFLRLEAMIGPRASEADSAVVRATAPGGQRAALWAVILAASAPLMWFTASRPMSDVPGLAWALVAQALLLEAWLRNGREAGLRARRLRRSGAEDVDSPTPVLRGARKAFAVAADPLTLGALVAGVGLGVRSQVLWLTLPLLAAVLVARARRQDGVARGVLAALPGAAIYAAGVLAWFIPMLLVTGWERYLVALAGQGGEDFSGVDMLWTHFGARRLAVGLWQTFVLPWSSAPLAIVVLLAAVGGAVVLLRRGRSALGAIALLAAPYLVFHTLFHETVTTRYALPLLPAICYLAVRGITAVGRRVATLLLVAIVFVSLAIGIPAIRAYAAAPAPIFRAVAAMQARADAGEKNTALGMHRRIATEARPVLNWLEAAPWTERLPSPRASEWRRALRVLREEPQRTVWFLGEPSRRGELRVRDLALVDPRAVRRVSDFQWNVAPASLLGGVRPDTVDLYEISAPGWLAGEGWALTPETAGMADKAKRGPFYGPIDALVRRRTGGVVMLVGGRHLGGAAEGPARIELCLDGRPLADFVVDPQPQFFLRALTLAPGALSGPGPFGRLTIAARSAGAASRPVHVAVEQFDLAEASGVLAGYADGWQEAEYDPSRQQMWRWASERATVLVHAGGADRVMLRFTAESPRRYFDRPSVVKVRVGERVLWSFTPDSGLPRLVARVFRPTVFSAAVPIDREALARASGQVVLETGQFFSPADRGQGADRRHLALRVLEMQVAAGQ